MFGQYSYPLERYVPECEEEHDGVLKLHFGTFLGGHVLLGAQKEGGKDYNVKSTDEDLSALLHVQ